MTINSINHSGYVGASLPSNSSLNDQTTGLQNNLLSAKNEATRPSALTSVKRALVSVFRKIVSVFQTIPHKFALLIPCYGTSIVRTPDPAKESHKVNPLPKPPRTFEYKSEVGDLFDVQSRPVSLPRKKEIKKAEQTNMQSSFMGIHEHVKKSGEIIDKLAAKVDALKEKADAQAAEIKHLKHHRKFSVRAKKQGMKLFSNIKKGFETMGSYEVNTHHH
ncbi:hypothetical protein [Sodalis sp.]|uniref:hypothetical protein n=1 Tax=Sodalis sp. (in: enterobacteria) TaxID=1898979 RepID=UPI0038732A95